MNIIGHKRLFLTASGVLVVASFAAFVIWGLKLGIDFTGGSLLEVEFAKERPSGERIRNALAALELGNVVTQPTHERGVILRFAHVDEPTHQSVLRSLGSLGPTTEKRFDTIGPTIGEELKWRSLIALAVALGFIILYIAWAFRKVSLPVSSWKYGVVAILALIHDVTIPTGVFAVLGHFRGVELDTLYISALLTILGFSVHDTIVVFDRIRENLKKAKTAEPLPVRQAGLPAGPLRRSFSEASRQDFAAIVNRSVNETITRSVNTSLTVLLVLGAVLLLGGETTRYFALALILGIVFGTYSSIFVASPLLVIWHNFRAGGNR